MSSWWLEAKVILGKRPEVFRDVVWYMFSKQNTHFSVNNMEKLFLHKIKFELESHFKLHKGSFWMCKCILKTFLRRNMRDNEGDYGYEMGAESFSLLGCHVRYTLAEITHLTKTVTLQSSLHINPQNLCCF